MPTETAIPAAILIHHSPGSFGAVGLCAVDELPRLDADTERYDCTVMLMGGATREPVMGGGTMIFPKGETQGMTMLQALSQGLVRIQEADLRERCLSAVRADASRRRGLHAT